MSRRGRQPFGLVVTLLLAFTVIVGCGGSDEDEPTPEGMGRPGADAAGFCDDFVADERLLSLRDKLRGAVTHDREATAQLRAAATSLRDYASKGLGAPATQAADALEGFANRPDSRAAATKLRAAGNRLDKRIEEVCDTIS